MYDRYRADPTSVSDSWREFFADYRPVGAAPAAPASSSRGRLAWTAAGACRQAALLLRPRTDHRAPPAAPGAAAGRRATGDLPSRRFRCGARPAASWPTWRRRSGVPTATSVRAVPAKLLEVNRTIVNNQLVRTTGRQGELHPPDRLRGGQGAHGRPGHERRLRRGRRREGDARGDPPPARRARAGRRRREGRRQPHPARAVHHRRRQPGLPGLRRRLRGAGAQGPHQQDRPGRLRRHHGDADQSGHPGHRPVGAPADARPGRHRRGRGPRLPAGFRGRRPADPGRPGRRQDGDPHLHLRPQDHPGGRVGAVPRLRVRVPDGRARLLRRGLRRPGHPLRAGPVAARRQRRRTTRATAATSGWSSRCTCRP